MVKRLTFYLSDTLPSARSLKGGIPLYIKYRMWYTFNRVCGRCVRQNVWKKEATA